jgi:hypothetical protein
MTDWPLERGVLSLICFTGTTRSLHGAVFIHAAIATGLS